MSLTPHCIALSSGTLDETCVELEIRENKHSSLEKATLLSERGSEGVRLKA